MNQQLFICLADMIETRAQELANFSGDARRCGPAPLPAKALLIQATRMTASAAELQALAQALLSLTQAAVLKDDAP